ncbi:MAG: helix-turn-helix domain-containing protein [Acidobacteriota bacterium]
MQRKSLAAASCPVARSLDSIGDWWSLLIVRDALRGATRFCEFERSLGVAKNILTTRLRKLVAENILTTQTGPSGYTEYLLTPKGKALKPVIRSLWKWGAAHQFPAKSRPTKPTPFQHFSTR